MSTRGVKKGTPSEEGFTAVWKETPPGPEQKELERLFKNNLIEPKATPNTVRMNNTMFMEFSPRVFAVHFRKTKAKYGLFGSFFLIVESD